MAGHPSHVPEHIGIIMDGNGRWAELRKKPRTFGHKNGITAAKRILKAAIPLGIKYITLYTFSTENWSRPKREVNFLMRLLRNHMRNEADFYHTHEIKVLHAGTLEGLPEEVQHELIRVQENTRNYDKITAVLAINYGGRDEIIRAVNAWKSDHLMNPSADSRPDPAPDCTAEDLARYLDTPEVPDPDLIIRTAGEQRLSNFLLWQCAYSEFYYSPKLWPDWDSEDLVAAVEDYGRRKRKFGGTNE